MLYLTNPPDKRKRKAKGKRNKRRPPAGWGSWKAYMAHIRGGRMAKRKRSRGRRNAPRKRRRGGRRNPAVGYTMNKRRRGRGRRNPALFRGFGRGRGIVGQITQGVGDAVGVVVGKAAARAIPTAFGIAQAGAMGLAAQVASALVASILARNLSPNFAKMVLAGGLAAPVESFIKGANIPFISSALSEDETYLPVGAYPMLPGGYGAYPQEFGEEEAEYVVQQ